MEDDEPLIVAKMIDFLYGLDYDDHRSEGRPSVKGDNPDETPTEYESANADQPTGQNPYSLLINAKAYIIADKYDIQALKEWAVTKYKEVLPTTWNSTAFTESARLIYDSTLDNDRMLREVIIRKASENVKVLFDRGEFIDLLQSHGDFAMEVLRSVVFDSEPRQEAQAAIKNAFVW
ncbi:hypothetical protein G7Y89_g14762 [Cudoniella acicularis]|uniref:Uncharacterized protein n=1 Tax=Cudoniella acicularis TaxID=354080 RepID=A0A8H4QX08_9HELO|nr:hypothetical protein G7Y89_g14762 [Cudoniella acicularis]